jgi:DNA-binding LacI/PurR family transcriptional regulator
MGSRMKSEDSITIKEVADRAGVSVATAGRAMGNYGHISALTRQKVLKAAEELNYVPNKLAQGMRSHNTRTIGVVVPDIQNNFFGSILAAMEKRARAKGYALLICNTNENREIELECLDMLASKQVDGILLASIFSSKEEIPAKYIRTIFGNMPVVLYDRRISGLPLTSVMIDNFSTAYMVTKYLIGMGHIDIATIGSEQEGSVSNTVKEREAGYRAALREAGITNGGISIEVNWRKPEEMRRKINILLDYHKISAVIIFNNSLFAGFLNITNKRNIRFPENMSVVTWDDEDYDEFLNITAVRQPAAKMGELAVDNLIEQIEDKKLSTEDIEITLNAKLMKRNSCRVNK